MSPGDLTSDALGEVLLVSSGRPAAAGARDALERAGVVVRSVHTAHEALDTLDSSAAIGLVLVELSGEGQGVRAAREIVRCTEVPVVFLYHPDEPEMVAATEDIRCHGYVAIASEVPVLLASLRSAAQVARAPSSPAGDIRTLLETTSDGFWVIDSGGRLLDVNSAYCAMSGYSRRELLGMSVNDLDAVESPEETEAHVRRIMTVGPELFRTRHVRKDGSIMDIEISVSRYDDVDGPKMVCFCRDVTEQRLRDEELQRQRDELETFFTINPDLLSIAKTDGRFLKVNRAWEEVLGLSVAEIEGRSFLEFVHPDDLQTTRAAMRDLDRQHKIASFVNRYRSHDGSYRSIEWSSRPVGATIYAAARDITDRLEMESQLEARSSLLAKLTEQVPGAICQFRRYPDGRSCFPYASENIHLVYEVTPKEVRFDAAPALSRIHPEDYDGVLDSILLSFRTHEVWECDYRVVLPGRGERWLRGSAQPEPLDDGSVLWHGYITDITNLKTYEDEIRRSEERWQFALEGAGEGVWDWNAVTGEVYLSPRWRTMLGYEEDAISGGAEDRISLVHPDDHDEVTRALNRHLAGETPVYTSEDRLRARNGSYRWVLDRGKVVARAADGAPLRVIGTQSDITERKAAEERIARLVLDKDVLLKDVHHRIKNNFASVESLLGIHAGQATTPEVASGLRDAWSRVASMRVLYEKLLETEQYRTISTRRYLEDLASSVLGAMGSDRDAVALETDISEIEMDAERVFPLGSILTELMTNSMKYAFAPGAGGTIRVLLSREDDHATLVVADDGGGLTEAPDPQTSSGFGLSLVRMMAEQLGGTAEIDSEPARGTRATVRFPISG